MTEDLVRDVFRSREHLVDACDADLAQAVRRRVSRRRAARWLAAGGLTLVTTLGVGTAALTLPRDAAVPPASPAVTRPPATATPGWRLESSLGAQIEVPEHWAVNNYGCNMTDEPSVVRGGIGGRACRTPEPSTKELAILHTEPGDLPWADQARETMVDGVPALRLAPVADQHRHHGWIHVPSRDVSLVVRTLDQVTTLHILDSFRLVDPDHLGCLSQRPPVIPQEVPPGGFVPPTADSVSACLYGSADGRLQASVRFSPNAAAQVVAEMNAAPAGRNPDLPPDQCVRTLEPAADVVLLVAAAGRVTRVWVTFTYCSGRGLDNGVRQAFLAEPLLHMMMRPLQVGYGYPGGPAKPGS